jgi:DNA-binding SARP family transcriptional activator/predicted ATPase
LLWPETSESQARNNLRQFIFQLRQALPNVDRFLSSDTHTIYWKTDEGQVVDLQLFERTLKEADASERRGDQIALRNMLEQAISIYHGDLLPSCYDDWITPERERLRQQIQKAYQKLVRLLEVQRDHAAALQMGQQLLRLDPLDEGTYVTLMRLHALNEDPASARRVYQTAVETLQRELGVEPGEMLHSAYVRLQHKSKTSSPFSEGSLSSSESFRLVGRQPEWQKLQSAWRRAVSGDAHLALITGEAGIGKSRLAEELFNWVARQGFTTAYTRSYEAEGRLSFAPITEWLRSPTLRPHLGSLDKVWLTEISRLLPELLSENPALVWPEPITEYGQRQRFFEALARGVLACPHPLLLWFDDLQWCDQETLEWLHFLLRFESQKALLLLGTARREEAPPDHPLSSLARQLRTEDKVLLIDLSPLDAAEAASLASQVQKHDLDVPAAVRLYHETEGNPFFVVETIRAEMSGARTFETTVSIPNDSHALPPRVHAVILRRLAQLSPPAHRVIEIGAAIGRAFPLDLLLRAGNEDEETVIHGLDELWRRHIVREQNANVFDFTHDKLREVAYAEVSAPQRRLIHRRIAQALEVLRAEDLNAFSAQLAAQYEQAGLFEQAISYYQQAAIRTQNVFAHTEALNLLNRALILVHTLTQSPQRDEHELALQTSLAISIVSTKGYGAPEVWKACSRAQQLCDRLKKPVSSPILRTLAIAHLSRTEFDQALVIGNQLLSRAEQEQDDMLVVEGHYILGVTLSWQGVFNKACWHLKRAVAEYNPVHARAHIALYSQDPKAICLIRQTSVLSCLGYPEQANQASKSSHGYALELSHPFTRAYIMVWDTLHYQFRRETQKALELAEAAINYCSEYQLDYWLSMALVLHGWALAEHTIFEMGIAEMEKGIFAIQAAGAEFLQPYLRALLGEQYGRKGEIKQGLTLVNEVIAQVAQSGEKWCEAELFRIKGELLQMHGEVIEAEIAFRRAIAIAQGQEAKLLELRAATSLARLWQARSRSAEAKQLLVPLYEWFTEGFDTPDLQAARALIAQL